MDEIAVLIPCFNEEITVGKVVRDFKKTLPQATVYVYDNNSTDKTVEKAKEAGAIVILDDNFKSIENAILYGRTIYNNILKFIKFQSMNLSKQKYIQIKSSKYNKQLSC